MATESPVLDKVISNIQEVRARGARVIAVATEGDEEIAQHADEVDLRSRATDWMLAPLLAVIPLQLLAYYIARAARPERRPAAQPGQDRHGRVSLDARGARDRDRPARDRAARARARAPAAARRSGCSPTASARTRPRAARPGQHLAARFCAKEAVAKALGLEAWSLRDVEVVGDRRRRRPRSRLHGAVAERARRSSASRCSVSLTHTGATPPRSAIAADDRSPAWLEPLPDADAAARASTRGRSRSAAIPGLELMERAGAGLAELVGERAPDGRDRGRLRQGQQRRRRARRRAAAARARPRGRRAAARARRASCGATRAPTSSGCPARRRGRSTPRPLDGAAAIVDAILGTGFAGEPREPAASAIEAINAPRRRGAAGGRLRRAQRRRRLDRRGRRRARSRADATVTFHAAKPGLWIAPGKAHAGRGAGGRHRDPAGGRPVEPGDRADRGDACSARSRAAAPSRPSSPPAACSSCGGSLGLTGAPCLACEAGACAPAPAT